MNNNNTTFSSSPSGWTNGNVIVNVKTTIQEYTLQTSKDGKNWNDSKEQVFSTNGIMYARLWNGSESVSELQYEVNNIDKSTPEVSATAINTNSIKISASDSESGIIGYAVTTSSTKPENFTGVTNTKSFENSISKLAHNTTYYVWIKDKAGNEKEIEETLKTMNMPEFFQNEKYDGNSMMCKKLTMLPIECIVRGYITGSGWASYKENGTVCGIKLPEGLKESDKLPEPIYTPSTKAEIGDHDENISFEQSIDHLEKYFPGKGREYAEKLRDNTIALYKKCAEYALSKGIIIADTKFEFGLDENGNIVIGDEMLTPDSSRFWPADGYEPGHGQPSFDKQFARDWLKANDGNHDWTLPQEIVDKTIEKYLQAYEMLTGKPLA